MVSVVKFFDYERYEKVGELIDYSNIFYQFNSQLLTRVQCVSANVDKILSLFEITVQVYPAALSSLDLYRRVPPDVSIMLRKLSTARVLIQSQPGNKIL